MKQARGYSRCWPRHPQKRSSSEQAEAVMCQWATLKSRCPFSGSGSQAVYLVSQGLLKDGYLHTKGLLLDSAFLYFGSAVGVTLSPTYSLEAPPTAFSVPLTFYSDCSSFMASHSRFRNELPLLCELRGSRVRDLVDFIFVLSLPCLTVSHLWTFSLKPGALRLPSHV